MTFWGIPWTIAIFIVAGIIGVPLIAEILLRSKWWKKQSDFYYSFNEKKK